MLPAPKEEREIKPILGDIPAFFNYLINFCFNVKALGHNDRGGLPGSNAASDVDAYRARLAATESRATSFQSQMRAGTLAACRRSCAIRRRIAELRGAGRLLRRWACSRRCIGPIGGFVFGWLPDKCSTAFLNTLSQQPLMNLNLIGTADAPPHLQCIATLASSRTRQHRPCGGQSRPMNWRMS
jgi:hypothetical protein